MQLCHEHCSVVGVSTVCCWTVGAGQLDQQVCWSSDSVLSGSEPPVGKASLACQYSKAFSATSSRLLCSCHTVSVCKLYTISGSLFPSYPHRLIICVLVAWDACTSSTPMLPSPHAPHAWLQLPCWPPHLPTVPQLSALHRVGHC